MNFHSNTFHVKDLKIAPSTGHKLRFTTKKSTELFAYVIADDNESAHLITQMVAVESEDEEEEEEEGDEFFEEVTEVEGDLWMDNSLSSSHQHLQQQSEKKTVMFEGESDDE